MVVFIATFLLAELIGYAFHRFVHHPSAGFLYRAHLNHHETQYPPGDLYSKKYRSAGKDSLTLFFIPLFLAVLAGGFFLLEPTDFIICAATVVLAAVLNDGLHTLMHLKPGFLWRFWWFEKMAAKHAAHHWNPGTNFGIYTFMWDRVFRTKAPALPGSRV